MQKFTQDKAFSEGQTFPRMPLVSAFPAAARPILLANPEAGHLRGEAISGDDIDWRNRQAGGL